MEKTKTVKYPDEFRERAVRMVKEHRGEYSSDSACYRAISEKLGCNADTLRGWYKQAAIDAGNCSGMTSEEKAHLKALEARKSVNYDKPMRYCARQQSTAEAVFASYNTNNAMHCFVPILRESELDRPQKKW